MISFNIATVERRKPHFMKVLKAMAAQHVKCDKINIACSYGYDKDIRLFVDAHFKDSEIIYGKFSCEKKFFAFNEQEDGSYFLTFDDDITYPADYTKRLIEGVEQYERKAVCGFHGMKFNFPVKDYHKDRVLHQYFRTVNQDQKLDLIGTGCAGFYVDTLRNAGFTTGLLNTTNMTDDSLGRFCRQNNIPMVCLKHRMLWMSIIPGTQDEQCTWRVDHKNGHKEQLKYLNADTVRD